MAAAYGALAAEYGWTVRFIRAELTDELLVMYSDAFVDRAEERARGRFDSLVEAVRVGTVFARDHKQYRKWSQRRKPESRSLAGDALESAVMNVARLFPDNVSRGTL